VRYAASLVLALAIGCPARAETTQFWSPGSSGGTSCATWLSNPVQEAAGAEWILGFVTGANAYNDRYHYVGRTTDSAGLIAEVRLACQAAPADTVQAVTFRVYVRLQNDRR
jgi:hypothetical protein